MIPQSFKHKSLKPWNHKSVLRLIEESIQGEGPEETITRKARALVARGRRLGWTGPPFDIRLLATLLGIKTKATNSITVEAQIIPVGGQFELLFREDVSDNRLNFTFAHEISHTLFPDCGEMVRERNARRKQFDPNKEIENLCNLGASHILMPSPFFEEDLLRLGSHLQMVDVVAGIYHASREATILRMISASESPCAAVYFRYGYNKEELEAISSDSDMNDRIQPRLRIASAIPSRSFRVFLPKNKSIPDDSVLYNLFKGEKYVSGTEKWAIKDFGAREVEGTRLYYVDSSQNLGIIAIVK
jgi:hypothetical protein